VSEGAIESGVQFSGGFVAPEAAFPQAGGLLLQARSLHNNAASIASGCGAGVSPAPRM